MGEVGREGEDVFGAEQDESMEMANKKAQDTFKYFWRELYWEYRRIVPALDFAMVKVPFSQEFECEEEPKVEHMWVDGIYFDGEYITGELSSEPRDLTNIKSGDPVSVKVSEISDWMFSQSGRAYGGFTVQLMRSQMDKESMQEHDNLWGLDFGDYNDIPVINQQNEYPENLIEHPMSKNMAEGLREFLGANPGEISSADENGFTPLHIEAIAGNKTMIEIFLEFGADKNAKSKFNKTPYDYAEQMNWEHIKDLLK